MPDIKPPCLSLLLIVLSICLPACTAVAPWERGTLAKAQMALNPEPMQSTMRAHHYGSREAASGSSSGAGGGGCGCY